MYASRIYAPRIRVPLLRYFVLVTPALLGFLYVAEAVMGPPPPMQLATNGPTLLKKHVAVTSGVQILSAPEAIAVPTSQLSQIEATAGIPQASGQPATVDQAASAARAEGTAFPAAKKATKKVAEHKKKSTKVVSIPERRDRFAGFVQEPRPYGAVW
jgi:hypothetical protein